MPGVKHTKLERLRSDGHRTDPRIAGSGGQSVIRARRSVDPSQRGLLSGQYRLLGAIGTSMYGQAYAAEQLPLKRKVTVHFLPRDASNEGALSRELPLVVAKCAQLAHPNAIGVEAYGRTDGGEALYYVVTQPLEGQSLADLLRATGSLPVRRALSIVRQMGRALRAAHKLGVVHGDLRPENVRLVETASGEVVKVVGFGKVALRASELEAASDVRTVNSPVYSAPEVLRGGVVDARGDVYSLGAVLYRLIAGEPPYSGKTPSELAEAHRRAPAPSLREKAGTHVPPEVAALVVRCLEKRPEDRFSDVVTFMQAMRIAMFEEDELLSRDANDVFSHLQGVNSILPSVSVSLDVSEPPVAEPGASTAPRLWFVLGALLLAAVLGEIWWEKSRAGTAPERPQAAKVVRAPPSAPP